MELNKVYQNPETKEYFYVAKKLEESTYEVWSYSDPNYPIVVSEQDVTNFHLYDRIDDETWTKMKRLQQKMDIEGYSGIFSEKTLVDSLELLGSIPRTPYIPEVSDEDVSKFLNEAGFNLATPLKRIEICAKHLIKLAPNVRDSVSNEELWEGILFNLSNELELYRRNYGQKERDMFCKGPLFTSLKLDDLYEIEGDYLGKVIEKAVNTSCLIIDAINDMKTDNLSDLALAIQFISLAI